jgi:hypothetical protein
MMTLTTWRQATVGEFWQTFAWQDVLTQPDLPTQILEHQDWRQLDVQSFFGGISWTGEVKRSPFAPAQTDAPVFSYTLSVRDFLAHIQWEGKTNIGIAPQLSALPTESQDLNLHDLSNLF